MVKPVKQIVTRHVEYVLYSLKPATNVCEYTIRRQHPTGTPAAPLTVFQFVGEGRLLYVRCTQFAVGADGAFGSVGKM